MNGNKPSRVFISYSHDTPEHTLLVLQLANALRSQGVDAELDQYHVRPPLGWPRWCEEQLRPENAAFVLVICTATYRQRVEGKTAADEGRGVFWEGGIIYNYLYNEKGNERFIPVLLPGAKEEDIPQPLGNDTRYRVKAFDLKDSGYLALYRELTGQPAVSKPSLGEVVHLPVDAQSAVNPLSPLPARQVLSRFIPADISRIIKYAPAELIGREAETKLLSDAWDKAVRGDKNRPHVLTIAALGGEGKTSLMAKWAAGLAGQDWLGCDAVFAWSFYSQGTRDQALASSDTFLKEALTFFGDAEMAGSAAGALDKGRRLAQLVGERRVLLLLDGLEPLQHAPTSPAPGRLKDQGVAALLKGLATTSHGLCVVTTHFSTPELRVFLGTTAQEEKLTRLSMEAGVALLQSFEVKGGLRRTLPSADGSKLLNEFEKLVEDVKGHALTLNLVGSYLRDAHGGDIRQRDRVKLAEADAEEQGGHAFRVMDAYVRWLEQKETKETKTGQEKAANERNPSSFASSVPFCSTLGQRALALLRLLGLFDRPATAVCLEALWKAPAIVSLTEPLIGISEAQRNIALARLEAARLLTVNRDASGRLLSLDSHPLIRQYFAQLVGQQPKVWRAANRRLYEHLCATTKEGEQPTLEDLQPLYQAVAHGCQAGLQHEACERVYFARILRGNEHYSWKKLGAYGSDLGAVACFFKTPWSRLLPSLRRASQAIVMNQAALCLRALGRPTEAIQPVRAGLEMVVKAKAWHEASRGANNLSELELMLGEVARAVRDAERSVAYADRSGDAGTRIITLTTHANALHQAGRRAETRFREAEALQAVLQPEYPLLYSLQGFRYCDFLLTEAERTAWRQQRWPGALPARSLGVPSGGTGGGTPPETAGGMGGILESCHAVEQRAARTLRWAETRGQGSLLTIALDHLALSRAVLYAAILSSDSCRYQSPQPCSTLPTPEESQPTLNSAATQIAVTVSGLSRANRSDYLPLALLTRAWLRSVTGARTGSESAQSDLDEAWEIAERGPMPLFLADIHLHRARLFGMKKEEGRMQNGKTAYPWESPQADLAEARRLIYRHGYLRRKEELEEAEQALLG